MASRILQKGKTRITNPFSGAHRAVDIGRSHLTGEPVTAHSAGTVTMVQTGRKNDKNAVGNNSYGNFVKIDHGNGYATLYAHLATVTVAKGERVEAAQVIGTMGNTGRSFGMHLHFEVRHHNARIDPTPYLEAALPNGDAPHVTYRAYAGKWWAEILNCHDAGTDGYAGVKGKPLSALAVAVSAGTVIYRAHQLADNRWLNAITGYNTADSRNGYAGNKGKSIDALRIDVQDAFGYTVQYRVSAVGEDWQAWCANGTVAGTVGKPIDRVQITFVKA